uniref:DUF2971 domain-containing protein n=1 Tax=Marinomonas sp. (strain MWYL1) TaxID=400668 RepID=A6W2E1_MARMS
MELHKYYSHDSFDFICVEGGMSLRYSQPQALNDPFEVNPAFTKCNPELEAAIKKEISNDTGDNRIDLSPEEAILFINERMPDPMRDIINAEIQNKIGILSLTINNSSRAMWSYYGKEHKGFMITISDSYLMELKKIDNVSNHKIVTYTKNRPININFDNCDFDEIFYVKDSEWFHEEEYRAVQLLVNIPIIEKEEIDIPLHCDLVSSQHICKITLGIRSSDKLKEKAISWIKQNAPKVELYQARPCRTQFRLEYEKIEIFK